MAYDTNDAKPLLSLVEFEGVINCYSNYEQYTKKVIYQFLHK